MKFQSYHEVWLSVHPERSREWLERMLKDGFHIHHIDGDHQNDDPLNLVLIESGDHMMLHNGKARLLWKPRKASGGRPRKSRCGFSPAIVTPVLTRDVVVEIPVKERLKAQRTERARLAGERYARMKAA